MKMPDSTALRTAVAAGVELSADAVFVIDDERALVDVNPAACTMLGATRGDLLEARIHDLASDDVAERLEELWDELMRYGEHSGHFVERHPDGTADVWE